MISPPLCFENLVEPRWVTQDIVYILVALGDPDESFPCFQMKRENGNMVQGMDFTPHISHTFSKPDRKRYLFRFELFLTTPGEVDPKVPDSVLRLPLNLQPSHLKLHQKDVLSTSVAVPIQ